MSMNWVIATIKGYGLKEGCSVIKKVNLSTAPNSVLSTVWLRCYSLLLDLYTNLTVRLDFYPESERKRNV